MTLIKKSVPTFIASCLLATAVFANTDSNTSDEYKIQLIKNCQVISEKAMTSKQAAAYIALKNEEEKMTALENPIKAIEAQIRDYSHQIEALTAKAIQEDDNTLRINKSFLKEQEQVAKQLNALMKNHQHEFTALESQGNIIGEVAEQFSDLIEADLAEFDHDSLRISSPLNKDKDFQCHRGVFKI